MKMLQVGPGCARVQDIGLIISGSEACNGWHEGMRHIMDPLNVIGHALLHRRYAHVAPRLTQDAPIVGGSTSDRPLISTWRIPPIMSICALSGSLLCR